MKEIKGDLLEVMATGEYDGFCVTTNGQVRANGKAVMGAGIAKIARDNFKGIDERFGMILQKYGHYVCHLGEYKYGKILTFPTKNHWRDKSDIELIKKSALQLEELIEKHGYSNILLPRPGCSNGGLSWEYVKEQISPILSDRIMIISK